MPEAILHHGDALALLRGFPSDSVDAIVTDPPYSSGGAFRGDRTVATASKYLGSYNSTTAGKFGEVIGDSRDALGWALWATLWLTQCYRVARKGAPCVVFTDWRQLPNCSSVLQAAGWVWRGIVAWDKGNACRPMSGRFAHQCEYAVWGTKGPIGWDYSLPSLSGAFRHSPVSSKQRAHQTEKPVALMEEIVAIAPKRGMVLDPFAGSGATGVACVKTGRDFVGIELSAEYYATATARINAARDALPSLLTA